MGVRDPFRQDPHGLTEPPVMDEALAAQLAQGQVGPRSLNCSTDSRRSCMRKGHVGIPNLDPSTGMIETVSNLHIQFGRRPPCK